MILAHNKKDSLRPLWISNPPLAYYVWRIRYNRHNPNAYIRTFWSRYLFSSARILFK